MPSIGMAAGSTTTTTAAATPPARRSSAASSGSASARRSPRTVVTTRLPTAITLRLRPIIRHRRHPSITVTTAIEWPNTVNGTSYEDKSAKSYRLPRGGNAVVRAGDRPGTISAQRRGVRCHHAASCSSWLTSGRPLGARQECGGARRAAHQGTAFPAANHPGRGAAVERIRRGHARERAGHGPGLHAARAAICGNECRAEYAVLRAAGAGACTACAKAGPGIPEALRGDAGPTEAPRRSGVPRERGKAYTALDAIASRLSTLGCGLALPAPGKGVLTDRSTGLI